jgi:hypothetical protein
MVHIQNVDLQNFESQNVENKTSNDKTSTVIKRRHHKTSTSQNVDTTKRRKQNIDTIHFQIRNWQVFLEKGCYMYRYFFTNVWQTKLSV